ncbi:MAG TPA: aldo/keto reductase [Acidobacteriaceae bacterium]|nr:aldo/keto reductase [Acidobacteriaceae bacterium]
MTQRKRISGESIDPARVPHRTLASGARIPVIGLGTFGSDKVSASEIAAAVLDAARIGYRQFDCASVYGNEAYIGEALESVWGVIAPRKDFWITSKLWNDKHAPKDVEASCKQSLRDLRVEYLDLYLVHWPFPNYHPPGCDVDMRSPGARPYIHAEFMETWGAMEKLVEQGMVRHIGTSNMTIPKLELLLKDARIRPACNEMELHPHLQQTEFFQYLLSKQIQPIGYCPLGSPGRPERDRTPSDTSPLDDPVIRAIADNHHVHAAEVCLKWAVQRGEVVIPFSVHPRNYAANLRAVVEDPLSADEMERVAAADRKCRLIKGQVFLWKQNQSWHDLWDENGIITPA